MLTTRRSFGNGLVIKSMPTGQVIRLRKLPASDPHPKRDRKRFNADYIDDNHPDVVAWKQRHPGLLDEDYPEATAGYGGTRRGIHSMGSINYLVRLYLNSQPGNMEVSKHKLMMGLIRSFYNGRSNEEDKLGLHRVLITRLELNQRANQYARALNLYKLPKIERWNAVNGYQTESYDHATFRCFLKLVSDSHIFHLNPENIRIRYSPYYRKPAQYLAAGMAAAGYNENDVTAAIDKIRQMRKEKKFMNAITLRYLRSHRYSMTISSLSTLLKDNRRKSKAAERHPRQSVSDIE